LEWNQRLIVNQRPKGFGTGYGITMQETREREHSKDCNVLSGIRNSRIKRAARTRCMTSTGKTVVLVVEDEPLLRLMAAALVRDAGFEASEASNADEAVSVLESRNDIRIVFTDIDIPGSMDGIKLASCIRDRWPPVEIIVTSGHFTANDVKLPARRLFFGKPYDPLEIGKAMRELAG
jgi:CheY-like chemotaxis protein